jgi:hypothetical protein
LNEPPRFKKSSLRVAVMKVTFCFSDVPGMVRALLTCGLIFLHPACSRESKEYFAVVSPLDDPMGDPLVSNAVGVPAARARRGHERRSLGTHPFDALCFKLCAQFDALTQIRYSSNKRELK